MLKPCSCDTDRSQCHLGHSWGTSESHDALSVAVTASCSLISFFLGWVFEFGLDIWDLNSSFCYRRSRITFISFWTWDLNPNSNFLPQMKSHQFVCNLELEFKFRCKFPAADGAGPPEGAAAGRLPGLVPPQGPVTHRRLGGLQLLRPGGPLQPTGPLPPPV